MTSTKMSAHKAGSARAMARQRLHEPVRARSTVKYSLKRTRDFSSQSSWGSRVAWRKMSHIISTGAQSGVTGKRVVPGGLETRNYSRAMVEGREEERAVGWVRTADAFYPLAGNFR